MGNGEVKDGEILFVYESKMSNPNGDPDNENIPRMDYSNGINLVSDVRLKRYIRDYFTDNLNEDNNQVFVRRGLKVQNATERASEFEKDLDKIISKCIDIRMFGATIALKGESATKEKGKKEKGKSIKLTGPVQFTWGFSLNQVELVNSYSITSTFSSESGNQQGTIGKDYRVYYSILAFYGVISSRRAKESKFTSEDLRQLDRALLNALQSQSTRTKIGQFPLLYIRTEYEKPRFIGDLRDYLKLNSNSKHIRTIDDYSLDITNLVEEIKAHPDCTKANFWLNKKLGLSNKTILSEKTFSEMNANE